MDKFIDAKKIEKKVDQYLILRFLTSNKWLAFFYGIFLFLYELKFIRENLSSVHLVLIAWAGALVVYNVVVRKLWRRLPYWFCIFAFAACAAITVLINMETGLVTNVKSWVMVVLPLCAFYPVCLEEDERDRQRTVLNVLSGAAVVSCVASAVSVWMYLQRYYGSFALLGVEDFVGVLFLQIDETLTTTILYGIYADSNHAAVYSLFFAVYSVLLLCACAKGCYKRKWINVLGIAFALVNFAVQVCFFPLANSRGAWLALLIALLVGAFLWFAFCSLKKVKNSILRVVESLLLALLVVAVLYIGLVNLRTGISQLSVWLNTDHTLQVEPSSPAEVETAPSSPTEVETAPSSPVEIETIPHAAETEPDVPKVTIPPISEMEEDNFGKQDDGTGSGRLVIWKDALELFMQKPIFGVGPGNSQHYAIKYGVAQNKIAGGADIHNSYLDLLVDYGIVGTLPMLCFWLLCVFAVLKKITGSSEKYGLFYYLNVFCVLLASGSAALLSCIIVSTTAMYYVMLVMTSYLVTKSEAKP